MASISVTGFIQIECIGGDNSVQNPVLVSAHCILPYVHATHHITCIQASRSSKVSLRYRHDVCAERWISLANVAHANRPRSSPTSNMHQLENN